MFAGSEPTPLEILNKSTRVYWPKIPWYDVIEASRILGMCPTVPDFANDGVVPKPTGSRKKQQAASKKDAAGPKPGDKLVYRNYLALGFGRPGSMAGRMHFGDVIA